MINATLRGFIRKELTQTLRDPRMRFVLFVVPVIQLTLFGVAISTEVKNIRLAAFFDKNDFVTRDIYERAVNGRYFVPAKSRYSDPFMLIRSGDADAVIVPEAEGFTTGLGHGGVRGQPRVARLQILVNAINVLQAQSVENYLRNIVGRSVASYAARRPKQPLPIIFDNRVLFNPDLETSIFMVPGTMCMLMIIATLVMTNNAIVREKEMGTFEMLISAPVTSREVVLGKTIPYIVLGLSQFPLILLVAVALFRVPMRGSFIALFAATGAFVLTTVAMGTLISTFCRNQQQASLAAFLFLFPAIMFSGLMFPIENMPQSIRWVAWIDPIAHYMGLLRNIMLKGGEIEYVTQRIGILLVLAAVSIFYSFKRFRTTLG
jgi:ABC-2 type transport system permease protein